MSYETFSEPQLYALDILQRVGCMSTQQMDYILGHRFSITTGQSFNVMHSLVSYFYAAMTDDDRYITYGSKDDKFRSQLDMNTVMALQVAIDIIGGSNIAEVADTFYKPYAGTHLRFSFEGTSFEVYVARLENASYIRFLDEKGKDIYEADKKAAGEKRAQELACKYLFVIPHEVNNKEALKMIQGIRLFMPHMMAFIEGPNYFERQDVKYMDQSDIAK